MQDVETGTESFAEFNHLHQTNTYNSSLCVVTILETINKPSTQCHYILQILHITV